MRKSEAEIEGDFYTLIKSSVIASAITGSVYRGRGYVRPAGAVTEDAVVRFLSGVEGQVQNGIVLLHVYVSDITRQGSDDIVENTSRTEVLEKKIIEFIDSHPSSEYDISLDQSPTSVEVNGIDQHVIITRINYQRIID